MKKLPRQKKKIQPNRAIVSKVMTARFRLRHNLEIIDPSNRDPRLLYPGTEKCGYLTNLPKSLFTFWTAPYRLIAHCKRDW